MEIKKSPKADLESKKLTFALIGLVVTLFIVWRVFEYKSYDKQIVDDLQKSMVYVLKKNGYNGRYAAYLEGE